MFSLSHVGLGVAQLAVLEKGLAQFWEIEVSGRPNHAAFYFFVKIPSTFQNSRSTPEDDVSPCQVSLSFLSCTENAHMVHHFAQYRPICSETRKLIGYAVAKYPTNSTKLSLGDPCGERNTVVLSLSTLIDCYRRHSGGPAFVQLLLRFPGAPMYVSNFAHVALSTLHT